MAVTLDGQLEVNDSNVLYLHSMVDGTSKIRITGLPDSVRKALEDHQKHGGMGLAVDIKLSPDANGEFKAIIHTTPSRI